MAEAKKTRERNFERSYSDKTGEMEISHNEESVVGAKAEEFSAETVRRILIRGVTDVVVGAGNAALKAGKTAQEAYAIMTEVLQSLKSGTFKFRSASGQGGLSLEDEQEVIAEALVALGKAPDVATALAKVQAVYARTKDVQRKDKETGVEKTVTTRPDYNSIKAVPDIKAALAKAGKAENNLDALLAA